MADNFLVILALLLTSVMVRVIPSLLTINFGEKAQHLIEEVLPTSIFICFITYIVMPEMDNGLSLSIFSFIAVCILAVILKSGLILTTVVATTLYYVLS
ncbi:hypothetical protein [Vreelandella stevensii]|uniref:hypothetical protein n=1 Tax=Vreelandella stevensii TaxID=502821 RepID=UPI00036A1625|nr:hypothetical protein [Halomonas stevensii]NGO90448.1 hypothetical protein [Halomonas sp.]